MTKAQLQDELRRLGVPFTTKMTKTQLQELLLDHVSPEAPEPPQAPTPDSDAPYAWLPSWAVRLDRKPPDLGVGVLVRPRKPAGAPPKGGRWVWVQIPGWAR